MPFYNHFTNIEQFIPEPLTFDPQRDLIRVQFETQRMYAGLLRGRWSIVLNDTSLAPSMRQAIIDQPYDFPRAQGIKIDKAQIGAPALFSVLGYDWKNIWRSEEPVTEFDQIRRTSRLKSTVILVKNK